MIDGKMGEGDGGRERRVEGSGEKTRRGKGAGGLGKGGER